MHSWWVWIGNTSMAFLRVLYVHSGGVFGWDQRQSHKLGLVLSRPIGGSGPPGVGVVASASRGAPGAASASVSPSACGSVASAAGCTAASSASSSTPASAGAAPVGRALALASGAASGFSGVGLGAASLGDLSVVAGACAARG